MTPFHLLMIGLAKELGKSSNYKSEFLANMSHELGLLQILKNLLSIAFKFTYQGEVSLTIARIRNPKLQGIEIEV